jgi:large subunit ribosomal protein L31
VIGQNGTISLMKKEIHPTYFKEAMIECACGNKIPAGSTQEAMKVEVCAACHPFFTGKQRLMDKAGMVEKFAAKMAKVEARKGTPKKAAVKADS